MATKKGTIQVNVYLSEINAERLLKKAEETECFARHGITVGKPSIGAMLKKIAEGEIQLIRR